MSKIEEDNIDSKNIQLNYTNFSKWLKPKLKYQLSLNLTTEASCI